MEPFVGCSTNPSLRERRERIWRKTRQEQTELPENSTKLTRSNRTETARLPITPTELYWASCCCSLHCHTHTHTLSLSLSLSKYKDLTAILTNPIQAKFLSLPKYNNLTAILTNPIQGKTSNHTRVQILQTGNGEFSMKTWDRIPCPTSLTLVPSTLVGRYKGSSVLNVCSMSTLQRWRAIRLISSINATCSCSFAAINCSSMSSSAW
jgi:hypothetical protein